MADSGLCWPSWQQVCQPLDLGLGSPPRPLWRLQGWSLADLESLADLPLAALEPCQRSGSHLLPPRRILLFQTMLALQQPCQPVRPELV